MLVFNLTVMQGKGRRKRAAEAPAGGESSSRSVRRARAAPEDATPAERVVPGHVREPSDMVAVVPRRQGLNLPFTYKIRLLQPEQVAPPSFDPQNITHVSILLRLLFFILLPLANANSSFFAGSFI